MTLSWLRRQWLDAISDWRKAPVCSSLGASLFAAMVLSVALSLCCGGWILYYLADPFVEYFHPGVDAPDSWALGITYLLYFVMGLCCGSVAFLAAGLWRAYRSEWRHGAGREDRPPDAGAGRMQG